MKIIIILIMMMVFIYPMKEIKTSSSIESIVNKIEQWQRDNLEKKADRLDRIRRTINIRDRVEGKIKKPKKPKKPKKDK